MDALMERMSAALEALELAAERLSEREIALSAQAEQQVERIVATVEGQREAELAERLEAAETKLAQAEAQLAELSAAASAHSGASGRKTAAVGMIATLSKQGISAGALESLETGRLEAGALDAALASLSIEQRFAVKAEMLRTGLLS